MMDKSIKNQISSYKVSIITAKNSWMLKYIDKLTCNLKKLNCNVRIIDNIKKIMPSDFAFYLSCYSVVPLEILKRNKHNLVAHPSNLPKGRGWSPLSWQILEGKNEIYLSLFEAAEKIDSGHVYYKKLISFEGHELIDELRKKVTEHIIALCIKFIDEYPRNLEIAFQQEGKPTYYKRRGKNDNRIDIHQSLKKQFNLLRIVDNQRYPAYFDYLGHRYILKIEKDIQLKDDTV